MSDAEQVLQATAGKRPGQTGWVRANCPFCEMRHGKADKKFSLGLKLDTGYWHCQRCGKKGGVNGADGDIEEPMPFDPEPAQELPLIELPDGHFLLYEPPGWASLAAEPARRYLRARGVDDDLGFDAKIGVCLRGKCAGRVVVPVFDPGLVGWSARDYTGTAQRKYLYPVGMRRAEILYNSAALAGSIMDDPLFICEGVFDALALWPDAVACLGKPTEQQVERLLGCRRPMVVLLDGDAWREAEALSLKLRAYGRHAVFVRLPPQRDPATMPEGFLRAAGLAVLRAQVS